MMLLEELSESEVQMWLTFVIWFKKIYNAVQMEGKIIKENWNTAIIKIKYLSVIQLIL